jgi:hypothetical protein
VKNVLLEVAKIGLPKLTFCPNSVLGIKKYGLVGSDVSPA